MSCVDSVVFLMDSVINVLHHVSVYYALFLFRVCLFFLLYVCFEHAWVHPASWSCSDDSLINVLHLISVYFVLLFWV